MNKKQRCVLIAGLLLIFLAGLFPPVLFVHAGPGLSFCFANGRTFLANPAVLIAIDRSHIGVGYNRIDYWRLVVEWLVIASATGILLLIPYGDLRRFAFRPRREESD